MKLTKTETTEDFDCARFASPTGQWEVGVKRVIFGWRVVGNRVGSSGYVFNYCAGSDRGFLMALVLVIQAIFAGLPEETTERELEMMLPGYDVKPIDRDPCWGKLQALAIELNPIRTKHDGSH